MCASRSVSSSRTPGESRAPGRVTIANVSRLLIDDIDLPAARELWARVWPLCRFLEGHSYSAAVKTACRLVGDTTGPVRAPLLPLDDAATRELGALLEHAALAPASR
jgi:dihydrodipicolinate synthase/N-acetylneuraminate lyase